MSMCGYYQRDSEADEDGPPSVPGVHGRSVGDERPPRLLTLLVKDGGDDKQ